MGLPLEVAATVATKIANNPVFHQNKFPESKSRALQVLSLILASLKNLSDIFRQSAPKLRHLLPCLNRQMVCVINLFGCRISGKNGLKRFRSPLGTCRMDRGLKLGSQIHADGHSRVVVLSSNFHQWERELLAAWHDRADIALPTQFAIVFPTPPDADRSVQEQVVIEQQSEPF